MANLQKHVGLIALSFLLGSFASSSHAENYIGLGIGQSFFDEINGNKVDDDGDTAAAVFLGRDFTSNIGAELYYHDLGTAGANAGETDSSVIGLSALYHLPNNDRDWTVYGRLGIAQLAFDAADLDDETELGYGLGLRWNFSDNWFTRLEFRGYGSDTSAIFLNAAYKFGGSSTKKPEMVKEVPKEVQNLEQEASELTASVKSIDSDNDGVIDTEDKCPGSKQGADVDASGCDLPSTTEAKQAILEKVDLKSVNFKSNSRELTSSSQGYLDTAAELLKANSTINIEIQAHTDSGGAEAYNLNLSEQRAQSVKEYLEAKGVDASRLTAKGYGEAQPIADNSTAEGKAKNRRVEFKVID